MGPNEGKVRKQMQLFRCRVIRVGYPIRCTHPSQILHIAIQSHSHLLFETSIPNCNLHLHTNSTEIIFQGHHSLQVTIEVRETNTMSHSSEKPTVLLVHGAWHNASCWDPIRAELKKISYPTEAVQLKSPGNSVTTHLEDTDIVRKALESLIVSEGKTVILVMHSYGGVAGTNAVQGLEAAAREKNGQKGGIINCLFVAAFLVPKGKSLIGMFPESPPYLYPDVSHHTSSIVVKVCRFG